MLSSLPSILPLPGLLETSIGGDKKRKRKDTIDPRPACSTTVRSSATAASEAEKLFPHWRTSDGHFCLLAVFPTRFHGYCSLPPFTDLLLSFLPLASSLLAPSAPPRAPRGQDRVRREFQPSPRNHSHSSAGDGATTTRLGDGSAFNLAREKSPWFSARPSATQTFFFSPSPSPRVSRASPRLANSSLSPFLRPLSRPSGLFCDELNN